MEIYFDAKSERGIVVCEQGRGTRRGRLMRRGGTSST